MNDIVYCIIGMNLCMPSAQWAAWTAVLVAMCASDLTVRNASRQIAAVFRNASNQAEAEKQRRIDRINSCWAAVRGETEATR